MGKEKKLRIGRPPKAPGTHVTYANAKITKETRALARVIAFHEDIYLCDVWEAALRHYAKFKGYTDE